MNEILSSLAALLSKSEEYKIWFDSGVLPTTSFQTAPTAFEPEIKAVNFITHHRYNIRLIGENICVIRNLISQRHERILTLPLNAPNSITTLEKFFGVK